MTPENENIEQFKTLWEEAGKLSPVPVDVDVDEAWNGMSFRVDEFEKNKKSAKRILLMPKIVFRVAAVVIPLITISLIYFLLNQKPQTFTQQTTTQTLSDTLSDGSVISMNKNSKLTYNEEFDDKKREVSMEGEVFFDVKPDKEKPFIIHAETTLIQVLGTSFNISSYSDSNDITVFVKTGRVSFSETSNETSITLEAGETGVYNKTTQKLSKITEGNENALFWKDKTLIFNRTKLLEVVETLQKYYNVEITLKNVELKNLHFTTTFKEQPIDSILEVIANTFDLKISKNGTTYILEQNEE